MLRIGDDAIVGNLHADTLTFPDGTSLTTAGSEEGGSAAAVAANAANIAINTAEIAGVKATLLADIASNTASIAANATATATNTTNIAANAMAIGTNTTSNATNLTKIQANSADIATNTAAIATKFGEPELGVITGSAGNTRVFLNSSSSIADINGVAQQILGQNHPNQSGKILTTTATGIEWDSPALVDVNAIAASAAALLAPSTNTGGSTTSSVSFFAYGNRQQWVNLAKDETFCLKATTNNNGGGYDTSTGKFTAPKDGMYHFDANLYADNQSQYATIYALIDGNPLGAAPPVWALPSAVQGRMSTEEVTLAISWSYYMQANQTMEIKSGSQNTRYYPTMCHFSGFLVPEGGGGSAGLNGAPGATGPAGPAGPQGPQGPQGAQGQDGQDGQDASAPIGAYHPTVPIDVVFMDNGVMKVSLGPSSQTGYNDPSTVAVTFTLQSGSVSGSVSGLHVEETTNNPSQTVHNLNTLTAGSSTTLNLNPAQTWTVNIVGDYVYTIDGVTRSSFVAYQIPSITAGLNITINIAED